MSFYTIIIMVIVFIVGLVRSVTFNTPYRTIKIENSVKEIMRPKDNQVIFFYKGKQFDVKAIRLDKNEDGRYEKYLITINDEEVLILRILNGEFLTRRNIEFVSKNRRDSEVFKIINMAAKTERSRWSKSFDDNSPILKSYFEE